MHAVLINNVWHEGQGKKIISHNPANQEIVWEGYAATPTDVNNAITAAKQAFKSWGKTCLTDRMAYIEKFISILEKNKDIFAQTIVRENGKPLWEAKTEVATMVGKYQASLKSYHARTGMTDTPAEISSRLTHRPIGVMIVFGPFNFPGHLPNGHIIPALLAGNTVVHKPSELTPLCGQLMAQYWLDAGLPAGVLNLVQGDHTTGEALTTNKDINGVLFTGSYKVGKIIHQTLAGRPEVMLALEMGGNNPLIIDNEINDVDAAVYNTIQSAFISAGQRCTCARRLFVPDSNFGNQFLKQLIEVTHKLAISDGINNKNINDATPQPFFGPVISLTARDNVVITKNNLIKKYQARELVEAKIFAEKSALISAGIVELPGYCDAQNSVQVSDEECFGPLLQVYRYKKFEHAIVAANNTAYGLAAGLLSDNKNNFELFDQQINAGIVNWNRPTTGATANLPFGGVGHSGNYRASAFYAADYCAYPMATQYQEKLIMPDALTPGVVL